jgi:hypothetical protein
MGERNRPIYYADKGPICFSTQHNSHTIAPHALEYMLCSRLVQVMQPNGRYRSTKYCPDAISRTSLRTCPSPSNSRCSLSVYLVITNSCKMGKLQAKFFQFSPRTQPPLQYILLHNHSSVTD